MYKLQFITALVYRKSRKKLRPSRRSPMPGFLQRFDDLLMISRLSRILTIFCPSLVSKKQDVEGFDDSLREY